LTGPPTVKEMPQQLHAVFGEKFQIACTATNDQDAPVNLMFSWRIPNDVQVNVITTDEDDSRTASSTLHINGITHSYAGVYQCIVRNGEGQSYKNVTLIVEGIFKSNYCTHKCMADVLRAFITTSSIQH